MRFDEKEYNRYAAAALTGLLATTPEPETNVEAELLVHRSKVAMKAHHYATQMIATRKEYIDYLHNLNETKSPST